jgi:hypothetical protein
VDISVPKLCGTDIISREAGKKVREAILKSWSEPTIRLLFEGQVVASVSFFDEAIGLLIKKGNKSLEDMRSKLEFPDLSAEDRKLLNNVMRTRIEENNLASPKKGARK